LISSKICLASAGPEKRKSMTNVTVNGKPVEQYLKKERDNEVEQFVQFEFRAASRFGRGLNSQPVNILSRPKAVGQKEVK
jgi:hypothetical protein